MFVLDNYPLAVAFCIITMLCWGSWANTQKLAGKTWRFELFYWDYVFGVFLMAVVFALTMGSFGTAGRGFFADLAQADPKNIGFALLGGVIFNVANILLVAAIAIAGMSVAFPVGIGLALVWGVLANYVLDTYAGKAADNPALLFLGVALIAAAIVLDAVAYRRLPGAGKGGGMKGLVISILCGILMGNFYWPVAAVLPKEFLAMPAGKLSPYTAMFFFSLGILLSNFFVNPIIMAKPFTGSPVPLSAYFRGTSRDHLWGIVGGMIWSVGMMFSLIAFGKAGSAISYGLGQGATLVAALWGVFIWREFREAPKNTNSLLTVMFIGYILGLGLIIAAKPQEKPINKPAPDNHALAEKSLASLEYRPWSSAHSSSHS
ncbi:MAG: multidrug DMT transporter permease [Pirellulales bacterium]|nr:multidrug DMT transporter permease [Pirellulales bacterium]